MRNSAAGISIWLDDLSREGLDSGNLEQLIKDSSVVGPTTSPTIFASALSKGEAHDAQVKQLSGIDLNEVVEVLEKEGKQKFDDSWRSWSTQGKPHFAMPPRERKAQPKT